MRIHISELSRLQRAALDNHFLALEAADRRLRFGIAFSDNAVRAYVAGIDFAHDAVFGVFDDELGLRGAAHVARGDGSAELGVSVLPGHRGRGIGGALLERAHLRARNWGVRRLFMHCLAENSAMMHLARKQGMQIVAAAGKADATLAVPPADAWSHFDEVFAQRVALFDFTLKSHAAAARRVANAFTPGKASPAPKK